MNKITEISIEICSGDYTSGNPYPEYDFTELEKLGVINESYVFAYSNKSLKEQIDNALKDKPLGTTIKYFYCVVRNQNEGIKEFRNT